MGSSLSPLLPPPPRSLGLTSLHQGRKGDVPAMPFTRQVPTRRLWLGAQVSYSGPEGRAQVSAVGICWCLIQQQPLLDPLVTAHSSPTPGLAVAGRPRSGRTSPWARYLQIFYAWSSGDTSPGQTRRAWRQSPLPSPCPPHPQGGPGL